MAVHGRMSGENFLVIIAGQEIGSSTAVSSDVYEQTCNKYMLVVCNNLAYSRANNG